MRVARSSDHSDEDQFAISPPDGFAFEPRMKRQSDRVNDEWTKRYCDLRLGTDFDVVPVRAG